MSSLFSGIVFKFHIYAHVQLAKEINLHLKELQITFQRNIRKMLAVRIETVNITDHHVGCNTTNYMYERTTGELTI